MIRNWLTEVEPETVWQPESSSAPARLATQAAASRGSVKARAAPPGGCVASFRIDRIIFVVVELVCCLNSVAMNSQCECLDLRPAVRFIAPASLRPRPAVVA